MCKLLSARSLLLHLLLWPLGWVGSVLRAGGTSHGLAVEWEYVMLADYWTRAWDLGYLSALYQLPQVHIYGPT